MDRDQSRATECSSLVGERAAGSRPLTEEVERLSDAAAGEQNVGLRQPFDEFQLEFYTLPTFKAT
jgi:hypothetical protein